MSHALRLVATKAYSSSLTRSSKLQTSSRRIYYTTESSTELLGKDSYEVLSMKSSTLQRGTWKRCSEKIYIQGKYLPQGNRQNFDSDAKSPPLMVLLVSLSAAAL